LELVQKPPQQIPLPHYQQDLLNTEKTSIRYTGFIAQEVEQAAQAAHFNFSGVQIPKDQEKELYGIRYAEFVVPLVKATQELNQKIEKQEKIIAKQQLLIEQLSKKNKEFADLKAALDTMNARLQAVENQQLPSTVSTVQNK